jgi:hypothetical protein
MPSGEKEGKGRKKRRRRAGRVAQMVEHLLSKCEALSSNPSSMKNKQTNKKYIYIYEGGGGREGEAAPTIIGALPIFLSTSQML